jgi:hypothetical protein
MQMSSHVMHETAKHVQPQQTPACSHKLPHSPLQHPHSQRGQTLVKQPVKLLHGAPQAARQGLLLLRCSKLRSGKRAPSAGAGSASSSTPRERSVAQEQQAMQRSSVRELGDHTCNIC